MRLWMWIWRISLMFKSENSFSAQISLCIILFSKVYKVWSIIVKVLFILLFTYCLVSQFSFSPMMLLLLWVFWYGVFLSTIILQFKLWFLFRLSKSFAFYFFKFKAFFSPSLKCVFFQVCREKLELRRASKESTSSVILEK